MLETSTWSPDSHLTLAIVSFVSAWLFLSLLARLLSRASSSLTESVRFTRGVVLPVGAIYYFFIFIEKVDPSNLSLRLLATLFWLTVIWAGLAVVRAILITRFEDDDWQSRAPRLFVDLVRLAFGTVGVFIVLAAVWQRDFGEFITTLGIGSLVVGLALQDTLGNLFAGIAIFFERPFRVGDWVSIGSVEGQVFEMNWRAIRLYTRERDIIILPNSILSKERIENFSFPSTVHGTALRLGFGYNDPPNKVKSILLSTIRSTPRVLSDPPPIVRTVGFGDSAVNYDVKFFIDDYARLPDINQDFLTRVWYAARRNGITIPFPVRTIYKTEVPPTPALDIFKEVQDAIAANELLRPLSGDEVKHLTSEAVIAEFAAGEKILRQGETNDSFFIIRRGKVRIVLRRDDGNAGTEVAELGKGEFFGEISVLTGEICTADVEAIEDIEAIQVHRAGFHSIITQRPVIAEKIAEIIEARRKGLKVAGEVSASQVDTLLQVKEGAGNLLKRIKRFLAL